MWKLYNTGCMDFHLFFCCANVKRLAAMLPEEERLSVRPLWQVTSKEAPCVPSCQHGLPVQQTPYLSPPCFC